MNAKDHLPRPWGVPATLAWMVAALAAGLIASTLFGVIWDAVGPAILDQQWDEQASQNLSQAIGKTVAIGVIFVAAHLTRMGVADYLALGHPRGGHAIEIIIVALAVLALPLLFNFVLAPALGVRLNWPTVPSTALSFIVRWIGSALITVLLEELLCRGLLYRGLAATRIGVAGAIVVTSILFAALHFQVWSSDHAWWHWMSVTRYFLIGLLLGWLRARTGSLLPGTAIHALNNGVLSPLVYYYWPRV